MLNKILLFLIFLTLKLTASLKPTDFCALKQQQECKGYYDKESNYQNECKIMKCNRKFSEDCGFNICSRDKVKCIHYFNLFSKLALATPSFFASKSSEKQKKFYSFNKKIPNCKNKIYRF